MRKIKQYAILTWKNLTIEPVVFFYLTSVGLISVIRPNLLIDKACRVKLNYTEEICDNLDQNNNDTESDELIEVQKGSNLLIIWKVYKSRAQREISRKKNKILFI